MPPSRPSEGLQALNPQNPGRATGLAANVDLPLVEWMVRALSGRRTAVDHLARLIASLHATDEGRELLPPGPRCDLGCDLGSENVEPNVSVYDLSHVREGLKDFQRQQSTTPSNVSTSTKTQSLVSWLPTRSGSARRWLPKG